AWKRGNYVDGFYHAHGGYAESGRVVAALLRQAIRAGVDVRPEQPVGELLRESGRVRGVRLAEGEQVEGDHVLLAAGSWTPLLLPELQSVMAATGHPVFHLKPDNPELFSTPAFVVFTADVSRTGWYGFPFHPTEQVIKIANHGPGVRLHPERDERVVTASDEQALRAFLRATFPALVNAPIVYTRRCLYTDTLDEHFWIDRHPEVEGLSVATGGSGHGFKFAPVLGALIADAVEGVADVENAWLARFRWRELGASTAGEEAARFHQPASGG
ncbi:MAG: FAD-dependent oxidoreductase, partial [Candidatus Promineifilaceae bacterium]|nr:FAD-dependent oxidoreductase [Candidatus Promineifilaceae bacterium]